MGSLRKPAAAAALCLLCLLALTGCSAASQTRSLLMRIGLMDSPYYNEGDTEWDNGGIEEYYFNQLPSELNEIYRELYARLSAGETSADLYARVSVDDFWTAYYAVLADHPELFWIGTAAQVTSSALTGEVVAFESETVVAEEEREAMRQQLESTADACIAAIDPTFSDYGKIKAVYEYLIDTTDYDASAPDNQCIQSALIGHASVCAGYSKAFQYILHRMGYFCTYITGTIEDGGSHGWNLVRIDGNYYHVDVTWGDPVFAGSFESGTGITAKNYSYLCCTDGEICRTHTPDGSVTLPACTDESYNYYRLNGMYYETFDYDAVYSALMNSVWNDRESVSLKFGSREAFDTACYELFENGMLHDAGEYLMDINGVSTWNYRYSRDEEFYLIIIQWR